MPAPYRAAVVTVSDSVAQGSGEDLSGPAVREILEGAGWSVTSAEVLPDDFSLLRERLSALASDAGVDAVFTTGGTGLGPRDRTPEATTAVLERSLPGVAEVMRRVGLGRTPRAALSRAVAGVKGKSLLINLPGAPEGARDSLNAILEILPHAVDVIRGVMAHPTPAEEPVAAEAVPQAPLPSGDSPEDASPADSPGEQNPETEAPDLPSTPE
ncbi:MAG: molybdenum cofactor biosynthesis protein B [Terriglobia bacterium]